ncbi:hypothetical protein ACIREO_35035 [Streptomyces sp. NPDC102441]|uniref:hypothetical protein n=1 Tax=Streptomyces sp. NPDC102441 TaxID=3366176 RepID=UPI003800429F
MDPLDEILARAAQRERDIEQMHADYEAIDAAEYEQFNAEMDAQESTSAERYQD